MKNNNGRSVFFISELLFRLYGIFGLQWGLYSRFIRWLVLKIEGGEMYSMTIRRIFSVYYGVDIGIYSYGCFKLYNFRKGTKIGNYCSIYHTVQAFNANHPMNTLSTHPFFYNPALGYSEKNFSTYTNLTIGNDVFIGHNAIILPSVTYIGDGAVIGAGSLVNKNIAPYSVAVGNPCRVVRRRYNKEIIEKITKLKWWEKSIEYNTKNMDMFQRPVDNSNEIK